MHADDFDVDSEPRGDLPDAYDEWPVLVPFNRLTDRSADSVIMDVRVNATGHVVVEEMPVRAEDVGGLEGRFGDWQPTDINSGPMADYEDDTRAALANRLPEAAPVEAYGRTIEADAVPGVNCQDCDGIDMCPACVRDWMRARGDDHAADLWDRLSEEL